jgi:hypothetical protein
MRLYLTIAGIVLVLGAGACGSSADPPRVATAGSAAPAGAPSATSNAVAEYVEAQRAWVKCMREHNYNLPDPDAKGRVDLAAFLASAKLPKTDAGFVAAQQACRSFQQPVPAELDPVPPLTTEQVENRRKYA